MTSRQDGADLGLNEPSSGTYGEKAALDRLESELPEVDPVESAPVSPEQGGGAGVSGAPPLGEVVSDEGYPPELFQGPPVGNLGAPGGAPAPGMGGIVDMAQARLATLDAMANSPEVSEATRTWARNLAEELAAGA